MIKQKILFCSLLIIGLQQVKAQNVHSNVGTEQSNGANASKGSGGGNLTNVDLFTGTASVNVPIHDFAVDGVRANVALHYVAKGIKIDEQSSSIGLGWQLQAGGAITREVNGLEDEVTLPAYFNVCSNPPNYNFMSGALTPTYDVSTQGCEDDTEHDMFHVNLLGRTFSFAMKGTANNIEFYCKPNNQVKIELITQNWNTSLTQVTDSVVGQITDSIGQSENRGVIKFNIIDEKGNKYFFERGDYQYKEFDLANSGVFINPQGHYYATRSWNLTRVETYGGSVIEYIYEGSNVNYIENVTEELFENRPVILNTSNQTITYDNLEITNHRYEGVKTHISQIHYPNGTDVIFDIANDISSTNTSRMEVPGDWILNNIQIKQVYNSNLQNTITYKLNHAYFNTPAYGNSSIELDYDIEVDSVMANFSFPTINPTYFRDLHRARGLRLKLKNIERVGLDGTSIEPIYTFDYNNTPLPYRFSPHKDFYGYYNGKDPIPYIRPDFFGGSNYDTFRLSIPYHTGIGTIQSNMGSSYSIVNNPWGLDRSFDSTYAQACVLTMITNANGGKELLEYQNYILQNPACQYGYNTQTKCGSNVIQGCDIDPDVEGASVNDGLCIKAIYKINGFETTSDTRTIYHLDSGQRFYRGGYTWYKKGNSYADSIIRTNYFIDPHNYYNGSNHGFSKVTIEHRGGLGGATLLSTSEYRFSNLMYNDSSYAYNNGVRSSLLKPTGMDYRTMPGHMDQYRMGLIIESSDYDHLGDLIMRKEYSYVLKQDNSPYASTHYVQSKRFFNGPCITGAVSFSHYIIDDLRMLPSSEKTIRPLPTLNAGLNEVTSTVDYIYDDFDNLIMTQWSNSINEVFRSYNRYNYNFQSTYASSDINTLNSAELQYLVFEEGWKMNSTLTDSSLIDLKVTVPKYQPNGILTFPTQFELINKLPVQSSVAGNLLGAGTAAISIPNAVQFTSNNNYGTELIKSIEQTKIDNDGYVLEERINDQDIFTSSLFAPHGKAVATVINAKYEDIAFTSFEVQKGQWDYSDTYAVYSPGNAMTGKHYLNLIYSTNDIKSKQLNNREYLATFWVNSTTTPSAEVVNPTGTVSTNLTAQNTVGDWKLYSCYFTPDSAGYFRIYNNATGVQMSIDEVRLHPSNATMETVTYEPLCGVSSKNSSNNYIIYMEYNEFGRIIIKRDMRGNILSKLEEFSMDQDTN